MEEVIYEKVIICEDDEGLHSLIYEYEKDDKGMSLKEVKKTWSHSRNRGNNDTLLKTKSTKPSKISL